MQPHSYLRMKHITYVSFFSISQMIHVDYFLKTFLVYIIFQKEKEAGSLTR